MTNFAVFAMAVVAAANLAESAKILGFFVVPSISHQCVYRKLMFELSKRGHQVTIVTPNPFGTKTENYTEIDTSFAYEEYNRRFPTFDPDLPEIQAYSLMDCYVDLVDQELSYEPVRRIFRTGKFDLLIVEHIIFPSVTAISHHFNIPFIGISSLDVSPHTHAEIGNPYNPAYYPDFFLSHSDRKTFFQRVRSTFGYLFWMLAHEYFLIPRHDKIARKHFGSDIPYIGDLEKNVSMVFANTDFIIGYPVPVVPVYLRIAGGRPIHMTDSKPLPQGTYLNLDGQGRSSSTAIEYSEIACTFWHSGPVSR